ncbi:MAG: ATP-binding protein, partial [Thermoplasmatota archaeon]
MNVLAAPVQGHEVQLYETDAYLVERITRFCLQDPSAGILVIATSEHRAALAPRLPSGATLLDAEATLAAFLVGGVPDEGLFLRHVGERVRQAAQRGPVRAFGEMVALLAQRGDFEAAAALEGLWNKLLAGLDVALLCAYPANLFLTAEGQAALGTVCALHAEAKLVELGSDGGPAARVVNILQERSNALSREVARRAQAERELADFVENVGEGLHRVGADGTILWANRAELELLGYAPEEYIGRSISDIHADAEVIADILERLRRGERIKDQPARLLHKDGSIRHVRITSNARFEGGRLLHTRCFTRDETAHVQLQEERRRLMAATRSSTEMLESATDGFLHVDAHWCVTFANIGIGHRRSVHNDLVGKVLWDVFPGMQGTVFEREFRHAMRTGEARVFEGYYAPADTWYEDRLIPAGGGLALYYRDITAKRQLEQQLKARNRQQAAVARLGQLALAERDVCRLLAEAVREAAEALDVEFVKVLRQQPDGGLLLVAGVGWREGLVGHLAIPAGLESQAGYTLQSGGSVIVSDLGRESRFHPTPLLVGHGVASGMGVSIAGSDAPWGVLSVHSRQRRTFTEDDIHFLQSIAHLLTAALERNRVEEELRRHRDNLEATVGQRTRALQDAVRELEAFTYTVSHDLRTPLRVIAGYSGLVARRHATFLPPEDCHLLDAVGEQAVRMGHLIESLLALSRLGRVEPVRRNVDLSRLAVETFRQLEAATPARQVAWQVEPGLQCSGDPELVRLVVANLLGNAWKFTSRTPEARVTVRRAGAAFCVEDNGTGFDMAHASELFQPFHRLHTKHEFEGTGIGLAIVARVVQRHGGRIWA